MKRMILHSMFAAAALAAVAGSASAQMLKAEVPFAFRASGQLMQPGSYQVVRLQTSNAVIFSLYNRETDTAVLLSGYDRRDPAKEWAKAGTAKLAFSCTASRCALRELWTGADSTYRFSAPKAGRGESREIVLTLSSNKAE
jgi:hypothetical protein